MADLKQGLADALDGARNRSLGLLDPLSDEQLAAQHSPLMSPLVWDLAHVGHYEELWLLRAVARTRAIDPAHDDIYDAFRHVRAERAKDRSWISPGFETLALNSTLTVAFFPRPSFRFLSARSSASSQPCE